MGRKNIDYKALGHFVCYTGRHGAGLTLASVAHVVNLHELEPERPIYSNTMLREIPYTHYENLSELGPATNAIVLLDMLDMLCNSRRAASKNNTTLETKLHHFRRDNNVFIANYATDWQGRNYVDKRILEDATARVEVAILNGRLFRTGYIFANIEQGEPYRTIDVRPYYAKYDTLASIAQLLHEEGLTGYS